MFAIITPDGLSPNIRADRVAAALACVPRGSAHVLFRDTTLSPADRASHQKPLARVCEEVGVQLFVHADLEPSGGAIHFPDRPGALALVQNHEGPSSVSTHTPAAAAEALAHANVVYLAPIWPTPGKPNALGPDALTGLAGSGRLFALGGITSRKRVEEALAAGADGVAGIRAFCGAHISGLMVG